MANLYFLSFLRKMFFCCFFCVCVCFWVDAICPSQQFFNRHFPGLNQYQTQMIKCLSQGMMGFKPKTPRSRVNHSRKRAMVLWHQEFIQIVLISREDSSYASQIHWMLAIYGFFLHNKLLVFEMNSSAGSISFNESHWSRENYFYVLILIQSSVH